MKFNDILALIYAKIKYKPRQFVVSVGVLALPLALIFSFSFGVLGYVHSLDNGTRDRFGADYLSYKSVDINTKYLDPNVESPKNLAQAQALLDLDKSQNLIKHRIKQTFGQICSNSFSGSTVSLDFNDNLIYKNLTPRGLPICFGDTNFYDGFSESGSDLHIRSDGKIPVLLPTDLVRTNPDTEHNYTKKELEQNYKALIGNSFKINISNPANKEESQLLVPQDGDLFPSDDSLKSANKLFEERIKNSSKTELEVIVVGFINHAMIQTGNTGNPIIFPDWILKDTRFATRFKATLDQLFGDYSAYTLQNIYVHNDFDSYNKKYVDIGSGLKFPNFAGDSYQILYDSQYIFWIILILLLLATSFIFVSGVINVYKEQKQTIFILQTMGFDNKSVRIFMTILLLINLILATVLALILSFCINIFLQDKLQGVLFGFFNMYVSNPVFMKEDISLFL